MNLTTLINTYRAYLNRTPIWLRALAGITIIAVAIEVLLKPFNSLALLILVIGLTLIIDGLAKLQEASSNQDSSSVTGILLILAGLALWLWPNITTQAIAIVAGLGLLFSGGMDLLNSLNGTSPYRVSLFIKGMAVLTFGLLALSWPDVALMVVAVAFGFKLLIMGLSLLIGLFWRPEAQTKTAANPSLISHIVHLTGSGLLFALALALVFISTSFHASTPVPDDFYTYNGPIPQPGTLLKTQVYTQAVPNGVRGWRILYSTTRDQQGTAAVASAFVMAPVAKDGQPQPIIAWDHGTTGNVEACAPTVMKPPMPLDNTVPDVDQAFANGWVMVGTDYAGLGTTGPHPYLIGQGEARSTLDSIRAARQMPELELANQTVIWGHSQGGGAALWTGGLAKSYAPELNIVGVAAAAPASDLPTLLKANQNTPVGKIMGSYVITSYSAFYPEIKLNDYVKPVFTTTVKQMSQRCLAEKSTLVSIITTLLVPESFYSQDPTSGNLGDRLSQNRPTDPIEAPVFIAQGEADQLVLPSIQKLYVTNRCLLGQALEYKTYPSKDHVGIVDNNADFNNDLTKWTQDRFAGKPAANSCPSLINP